MHHSLVRCLVRFLSALFLCTAFAHPVRAQFATEEDAHDYFKAPTEGRLQDRLRTNERHHLGLGLQRLKAGSGGTLTELRYFELNRAKGEFDFILNFWPNHPYVLSLQSTVLLRMKRPDLIEQYFDRAYQFNPQAGPVYIVHGISWLERGDPRKAIEKLKAGLELEPNSTNGHYNLGLAYFRLKDYERANIHAQKAYALGFPLPGLMEQLKKVGAWKPLPTNESASADAAARASRAKERSSQ